MFSTALSSSALQSGLRAVMGSSLAVAGGPAAGAAHEAHKLHILAHTARPLPSPHSPTKVTRAFGKLNFHKIVRRLIKPLALFITHRRQVLQVDQSV